MLASILTGRSVDMAAITGTRIAPWLASARAEGVTALVARELLGRDDVSEELRAALSESSRGLAAAAMLRDAACRGVLAALPDDLPVLVLKGLALGQWLYPQSYLREASDIDLYFASRTDAERAAKLLAPLGYVVPYRPGKFAHEFLCRRQSRNGVVDLDMHWALTDAPIFRELPNFSHWYAAGQRLPRLGERARGLSPVDAVLHASIHRAANLSAGLGDRLKWLFDLHLLAQRFVPADWETLQRQCVAYGLCGVSSQALLASTDAFATCVPAETMSELEAGASRERIDATRLADWRYVQYQNLLAVPGFWHRLQWLWGRVFPPTDYLPELYGNNVSPSRLWWLRAKRAIGRVL